MADSPLILVLAIVMLVYWFRYACTSALRARTESDCVARVAAVNGLTFLTVQTQLQTARGELDALRQSLDRDYGMLLYLLRNSRSRGAEARVSIALVLLRWDHLAMQMWYWCVRSLSSEQARRALEERARILVWLAHEVGRTSPADGSPASHATIMTWHPKRHSSQRLAD